MKIAHEFSPITIVLETKKDRADFENILRSAAARLFTENGKEKADLYVKVCGLLKEVTQ